MSVYFIRDDRWIKIGVSVDPWNRLATFQTSHHNELELLAIMPGGADLESGLHRSFAQYAKRGEWFEENQQLLDFIEVIKATFPDAQRRLPQQVIATSQTEERAEIEDQSVHTTIDRGVQIPMEQGESYTFRMTPKGLFRYPCKDPHELWSRVIFGFGGYWSGNESATWRVLYAPGLRFEFVDMQNVIVTRVGEISDKAKNWQGMGMNYLIEIALKDALKNAVYNRKNTASWLGVYNDERYGIIIAVKRQPDEEHVRLDVPEEVIDYWRQYKHPSPLPDGVSIEA